MTEFRVTDPTAPRRAVDPDFASLASGFRRDVASATPVRTGRLRAGWRVQRGRNTAVYLVVNDVDYALFVEFGTRHQRAHAMLGRTLAAYRGR